MKCLHRWPALALLALPLVLIVAACGNGRVSPYAPFDEFVTFPASTQIIESEKRGDVRVLAVLVPLSTDEALAMVLRELDKSGFAEAPETYKPRVFIRGNYVLSFAIGTQESMTSIWFAYTKASTSELDALSGG